MGDHCNNIRRRSSAGGIRRYPFHPLEFSILFCLVVLHVSNLCITVLYGVDAAHEETTENVTKDSDEVDGKRGRNQLDTIEDSMFDGISVDPSCQHTDEDDCNSPPKSTIEEETIEKFDPTCFKGAGDTDEVSKDSKEKSNSNQQCVSGKNARKIKRDKHWGHDPKTLSMRDQLRHQSKHSITDSRPPIFLLPGLASTRLIAWKFKKCTGAFPSDIKVQDNVWLNINLVIKMGTTIDVNCMKQCLELGLNQSDFKNDEEDIGCKLRPDEGLDAIASLAPGGIGADLLVGGTNTVYSWLIQWLADNLGYDVTNIIGLPYDWRLTPSVMEARDGFLSMTRKRIEAAVSTNNQPGIMVAHSMGNTIFRYFIEWLRVQLREEAYHSYVKRAKRREESLKKRRIKHQRQNQRYSSAESSPKSAEHDTNWTSSYMPGWVTGIVADVSAEVDEWYGWFKDKNDKTKTTTDASNEILENQYRNSKFRELAKLEGDEKWIEWLQTHIWTYVGLSAPMLGAINPLRAVISGENMGLPVSDDIAREIDRKSVV